MSANLNSNFTFTKKTMLQVSFNYRSARITPQGKIFPAFVANAGLRQDFFKNKLSVTCTISDIFHSVKQITELNTHFLTQHTLNKRDAQIIYLGISYRFGSNVKTGKDEKLQFDNSL